MRVSIAVTLVVTAVLVANAQRAQQETYPSSDLRFKALVYTSDGESRVSVITAKGSRLAPYAFTSDDKQNG